jgi:hypothetical protein
VHVFLFNDMLLIVSPKGRSKYDFKFWISLDQCRLVVLADSERISPTHDTHTYAYAYARMLSLSLALFVCLFVCLLCVSIFLYPSVLEDQRGATINHIGV